jgi:hypothetical protein
MECLSGYERLYWNHCILPRWRFLSMGLESSTIYQDILDYNASSSFADVYGALNVWALDS